MNLNQHFFPIMWTHYLKWNCAVLFSYNFNRLSPRNVLRFNFPFYVFIVQKLKGGDCIEPILGDNINTWWDFIDIKIKFPNLLLYKVIKEHEWMIALMWIFVRKVGISFFSYVIFFTVFIMSIAILK